VVNVNAVTDHGPGPADDRAAAHLARHARHTRTASADVEGVLLEAAERLLEAEGCEGLSIRRIAGEAGVAPMSVYNRFGNKAGIVDELFGRGFDELAEETRGVDEPDPLVALREASHRYHAFALAHPALYAVMFERAVPGYVPSPEAVQRAIRCFEELAHLVRRALAAGALVDGDPTEITQQIWSACHGAVSLQLRGLGCVPDMTALHADLVDTVLRGLGRA
jgi:AcrR family transcriptional regulator